MSDDMTLHFPEESNYTKIQNIITGQIEPKDNHTLALGDPHLEEVLLISSWMGNKMQQKTGDRNRAWGQNGVDSDGLVQAA